MSIDFTFGVALINYKKNIYYTHTILVFLWLKLEKKVFQEAINNISHMAWSPQCPNVHTLKMFWNMLKGLYV